MTLFEALITLCVAGLAASPGLFALLAQRKRNVVDLAEKLEAMNMRQIEISESRKKDCENLEGMIEKERKERKVEVEALQSQIADLSTTLEEWEAGIRILTDSLVANQIPVPWRPKARRVAAP